MEISEATKNGFERNLILLFGIFSICFRRCKRNERERERFRSIFFARFNEIRKRKTGKFRNRRRRWEFQTEWPVVGVKSSPIFSKSCPKSIHISLTYKSADFHDSPQLLINIWATFTLNFVPKNFKKSPNLTTLVPNELSPSRQTALDEGESSKWIEPWRWTTVSAQVEY